MKGTLTSYNHRPSGCFFVRCHRPFPRPLRKPQRTLVLGGSQGGAAVWMWGLPSPSVPRTELMVHRFLELPLLMDLFWKWNWGPSWNLCKDLTCNKTVLLTVKATFCVFFDVSSCFFWAPKRFSLWGTCNFSVNLNSVGKDTWVAEMVQAAQADWIH